MRKTLLLPLALLLAGCAQLAPVLEGLGQAGAPLSEGEIITGLREALAQGTTRAVGQLGRNDGFWRDLAVRVPLPDALTKAERMMRTVGLGSRLDEFHLTLNRAAEKAVPEAAQIFGDAVRQMTIADARGILTGADDAATQFFRRTAGETLRARFEPIVQRATQQVGVTQQYKRLVQNYGPLLQAAGMRDLDLDTYVTARALDGLFLVVAAEEKRIRQDPIARTSEILRRVFGRRD